jgi:hypothetical protein
MTQKNKTETCIVWFQVAPHDTEIRVQVFQREHELRRPKASAALCVANVQKMKTQQMQK